MTFCCQNMTYYVKEDKEIKYSLITKNYFLRLGKGTLQKLWYCPWCGNELPKDIDSEWFKILREEYNIKDPIFDDADKVPKEFKTDEWWKKRGL